MKKNGIKYLLLISLALNFLLVGMLFTGYRHLFRNSPRKSFHMAISKIVPISKLKIYRSKMHDSRFELIHALEETPMNKKKVSNLFKKSETSRRDFHKMIQKHLK